MNLLTERHPTVAEINAHLTRAFCGLAPPPMDAPEVEFHKYVVAGFFLLFCSEAETPEQGKANATEFLLEHAGKSLEAWRPHMESALGRTLTVEELAKAA